MPEVTIITDTGLSERSARINLRTWQALKTAKGNSAFFPDAPCVIHVGKDPFNPDYILFAADETMGDNIMTVSADVKERYYKNRNTLNY